VVTGEEDTEEEVEVVASEEVEVVASEEVEVVASEEVEEVASEEVEEGASEEVEEVASEEDEGVEEGSRGRGRIFNLLASRTKRQLIQRSSASSDPCRWSGKTLAKTSNRTGRRR
jgi:hypothetical protein